MTTLKNDTRFDDLRSLARELGRDKASGADAKMKLVLACVRAAYDGYLTGDDVETVYTEFVTAESKKAVHEHTAGGVKANVSKLKQPVLAALLPKVDFVATCDRVVDLRDELRSEINGNDEDKRKLKAGFDAIVDIARAQLKSPDADLDDDTLRGMLATERMPKDEMQKLTDAYKKAYKLWEDLPSAHTEAAVHAYADAIKEADGDIPPMTKEEKKAADAIAYMRSRGFQVQVAA